MSNTEITSKMAENGDVNKDQSLPVVKINFVTQIEDLKVFP